MRRRSNGRDRDGVNKREREMAPNNQKKDGFSTERETNENEGEEGEHAPKNNNPNQNPSFRLS